MLKTNNLIKTLNDLGKPLFMFVEECQKISVSQIKHRLNAKLLSCEIESQEINLTTTDCNYGGFRYWFVCPGCGLRVGTLYKKPLEWLWRCRHCQELNYRLTYYHRLPQEKFYKLLHKLELKKV